MEYSLNQKLIHNTFSPLLIQKDLDIADKNRKNNKSHKNIIQDLKRKLLPLKLSDEKIFKNKFPFNEVFNKIKTRNKSNKYISNSVDLALSGEILENGEDKIMNKYFYPDMEKRHEKSKILNEHIDINNILTFYSKQKYKNEMKDIYKIVQKQKKKNILTNDYSNINKDLSLLFSSENKKSFITNTKTNNQLDSKSSHIVDKKGAENSLNNCITIDIHKILYKNPFHSFNTIKKNQIIHNSVIDDYNCKCIKKFKKLDNELGPLLNIKSNSLQKLKIFPSIQKIPEKISNFRIKLDRAIMRKASQLNILNSSVPLYFPKDINFKNKQRKFLLKVTNFYPGNNSPESRSQFILVKEGNDIILHGGYNISRKHNIWKFNPNEKTWESIKPIGLKNELRFAHTGALYHRNLYIFGGKYFKGIEFADIEIFNLDKKCWIFPELEPGKRIPLRRNHVSCGIGNTMFVHGGMNFENKYLDDMYLLNYKPLKWNDVDIVKRKIKIPPLAHHCCCLVVPAKAFINKNFNIYSSPELSEKEKEGGIKVKGIYIFGGKISSHGPINKYIYVIKLGIKPFDIVQLKTSGVSPCPRYDSSLNFYEKGNMLIVHGGRNNNKEGGNGLNDTFILDLYQLSWKQVEYYNENYIVRPRYFHQSIEFDGNLFIFGGIEGNNFIGSELEIIDLTSNERCERERFILENIKKKIEEEKNEMSLRMKKNFFEQKKNEIFDKLKKKEI